jgi:hypothetical protein
MRRGFYLAISRAALIDGNAQVADAAARVSLAQVESDDASEARGKLYGAAARIFGDQYDQSLAELNAIDVKKLPKRDVPLLAAVKDVAARVHEPSSAIAESPKAPALDAAKEDDEAAMTIRLAEAAVARSDSLVKDKSR